MTTLPDEIAPLWGPSGNSILTFVSRDTKFLPQGHVIIRPSYPDPEVSDEPTQSMLALPILPEVASQYGLGPSAAAQAQNEVLPLDDRHITLVYLGKQDGLERKRLHDFTRRWLADADWPPMEGRAQGYGTFAGSEDGNKSVLWMSWDIPGLAEMRTKLLNDLKANGFTIPEDHDFTPHETLAYVRGPIGDLPEFPEEVPTQTFNGIVVGEDEKWTEYPFPMTMSLLHGSSMSLTAALEAAVEGLEGYTDEELDALIAAGGVDRNRGNAERLRRYWTIGPGGAKIKWNTPGDWKRCVAHLSKYLGPRAKGYCALRHKEMTRLWTGDMKHRILYGWGGKPGSYWAKVAAHSLAQPDWNESSLVATGGQAGEAMDKKDPVLMLVSGAKPAPVGFRIPLLLPEGIESGDGRTFREGVVEVRDLPIPLLWQPNSMQGHDGSGIVGRIDSIERVEGGLGNATGIFDSSPIAQEAVRMIDEGFLRGVSADLDKFEAKIKGKGPGTSEGEKKDDDEETVTPEKMDITQGRIMAATLVAKPAFQEARIELIRPAPPGDGDYTQELDSEQEKILNQLAGMLEARAKAKAAITASGEFRSPIYPPSEWFTDPRLSKPTHLTVTDRGRVYGHIAAWHVDHIGLGFGTRPPRSRSGYAYFCTGLLRTKEGEDIRVGQLTLVGGHASLSADAREAVKHYDDTSSAWADVTAGEDAFGIWVAGAVRPTVGAEQIRIARASSPSGDWRPVHGALELVAVCSVNVPGFPVVEARIASGQVMALVAAGMTPLYADQIAEFNPTVAAEMARQRMYAPMREQAAQLSARMYAPMREQALQQSARMVKARFARVSEFKDYSTEQRKNMEKSGIAMKGGGYPIKTVDDLKNAIKAYGRAKDTERAAVRRHIAKRARALGKPELIPENWKNLGLDELSADGPSAVEFKDYSTEKRKELEKSGAAMKDGRYPIASVADLKNAIHAYGRGNPKDKPAIRRHITKRARALNHPELIPDSWKDLDTAEFSSAEVEALVASVKTFRRREWDETKVARDDVGRFRKIYYRLRNSSGSAAPEVRAALKAVKEAERIATQEGQTDTESARTAADALKEAAISKHIDERTKSEVIRAAQEMASLIDRIEARGRESTIPFDQLPTEIQDAMKRYMKQTGLQDRITRHFGPYMKGEVTRSVADIVNFLERIIVDSQNYRGSYDTEHV